MKGFCPMQMERHQHVLCFFSISRAQNFWSRTRKEKSRREACNNGKTLGSWWVISTLDSFSYFLTTQFQFCVYVLCIRLYCVSTPECQHTWMCRLDIAFFNFSPHWFFFFWNQLSPCIGSSTICLAKGALGVLLSPPSTYTPAPGLREQSITPSFLWVLDIWAEVFMPE